MKTILIAVLGVVCIVAPWILGSPVRDFRDWRASSSWREAPATVTSLTEKRIHGSGKGRVEVDVHYEFTHEGRKYEDFYRIPDAREYTVPKKGERRNIKVNPRDPTQSLFSPKTYLIEQVIASLLVVAAGFWLLWKVFTGKVDDINVEGGAE